MKKTVLMMILLTFVFLPMFGFQRLEPSSGGVLLRNHESIMEVATHIPNIEHVKEIVVLPSEEFNETEVLLMIRQISHIHSSILEKAVNQDLKLKFFQGPLTSQTGFTHLKGVKPRGHEQLTWDDIPGAGGSKLALAKIGYSEKGKSHGSVNLELHEFAHSIDLHVFHSLRNDHDFLEIWKEEAVLLFPSNPYFIENPEEYFAEVFAMFYFEEHTQLELFNKAPKTYLYLKELPNREDTDLQRAFTFR
ncbi:anthrax toxin lethal factor-related metalloendopeptidase [Bacillus pinisoli]|uniref:anthrax toxin lethal factor-related metalloendopeptidase n=1 Tax=Bacillus pinisoli TaxID=2901866 RepID=UPI001FF498CA|nr:toxin [Bacillus pinisoli]